MTITSSSSTSSPTTPPRSPALPKVAKAPSVSVGLKPITGSNVPSPMPSLQALPKLAISGAAAGGAISGGAAGGALGAGATIQQVGRFGGQSNKIRSSGKVGYASEDQKTSAAANPSTVNVRGIAKLLKPSLSSGGVKMASLAILLTKELTKSGTPVNLAAKVPRIDNIASSQSSGSDSHMSGSGSDDKKPTKTEEEGKTKKPKMQTTRMVKIPMGAHAFRAGLFTGQSAAMNSSPSSIGGSLAGTVRSTAFGSAIRSKPIIKVFQKPVKIDTKKSIDLAILIKSRPKKHGKKIVSRRERMTGGKGYKGGHKQRSIDPVTGKVVYKRTKRSGVKKDLREEGKGKGKVRKPKHSKSTKGKKGKAHKPKHATVTVKSFREEPIKYEARGQKWLGEFYTNRLGIGNPAKKDYEAEAAQEQVMAQRQQQLGINPQAPGMISHIDTSRALQSGDYTDQRRQSAIQAAEMNNDMRSMSGTHQSLLDSLRREGAV